MGSVQKQGILKYISGAPVLPFYQVSLNYFVISHTAYLTMLDIFK
jgi:hypothetical protein